MFNQRKFELDIENIKTDFAMENMVINENDIDMLRNVANNEININEAIKIIKNEAMGRI